MPIDDVLQLLEPLQQHIVRLTYVEGLSPDATAQVLAVHRVVVGTALAVSSCRVQSSVHDPNRRALNIETPAVTLVPHRTTISQSLL